MIQMLIQNDKKEQKEKSDFHVFRAGDHLGFESIAELRNALLKSNNCVVSINNEHMVFSTYDIANQKSHYSEQKYINFAARLYLEENAQMLKVPGSLKLVFIKNFRDTYNEAFCSRFQKVHVRLSDFVDPADLKDKQTFERYVSAIYRQAKKEDGTPLIQGLSEAMVFSLLFRKETENFRYHLVKGSQLLEVAQQLAALADGSPAVIMTSNEDSIVLTSDLVSQAHKDQCNVLERWTKISAPSDEPSCEVIFTKSRLNLKQTNVDQSKTVKLPVLNTLETSDQLFQESLKASDSSGNKLLVYAEFSKAQKYMVQIQEFVEQHPNSSVMVIYSLGNSIHIGENNPFTGLPFCFTNRWSCRYIEDLSILTSS